MAAIVLAAAILSPPSARAGAWTQPKGGFWVKGAFLYQFTKEFYAAESARLPDGTPVEAQDVRPYDDAGAALQKTLWLEAEYGLTRRLTLGVQLPYNILQFEDDFQLTRSWGFGDIRFVGRFALLTGVQRLTVRGGWKLGVGKAATDPFDLPVSEGQTDLELGLQWGMGLGGREMSWLGAEAGYRWRQADDQGRDPGDEAFWRAEAGWLGVAAWHLGLKAAYSGQVARTTWRDGFPEPGHRSFHALEGALLWRFTPALTLEPAVSSTFAGEAFPSGAMYSLSLHAKFGI